MGWYDYHLNVKGASSVGRALAAFILAKGLLPAPAPGTQPITP